MNNKERGLSRREFIVRSAGAAAALLLPSESSAEPVAPAEIESDASKEQKEENKEKILNIQECADLLLNSVYEFLKERYAYNVPLTIDRQEELRREFKIAFSDFDDRCDKVYSQADSSNTVDTIFSATISYLAEIGAQGLVYKFLAKKIAEDPTTDKVNFGEAVLSPYYYAARADDYLPATAGKEVVDPRNRVVTLLSGSGSQSLARSLSDVKKNIMTDPGWTDEGRIRFFNEVLANPVVRKRFQENALTLAECFSLIKAIYRFKTDNPNLKLSDDEILVRLLFAREAFIKREILSDKTERFIHFDYYEKDQPKKFNGDQLDVVAKAAGVDPKNIIRINGAFNKNIDGSLKLANEIGDAIQDSDGKITTLYFNSHGERTDLSIDNLGSSFSDEALASYLIVRLLRTKDPDELGKITIVIDACFSYDFARNLIDKLRKEYVKIYQVTVTGEDKTTVAEQSDEGELGINFGELMMPTIVTSSQEGSFSFSSYSTVISGLEVPGFWEGVEGALSRDIHRIAKEGRLDGRFLMQRTQSQLIQSDMTFFLGGRGASVELGLDGHTAQMELEKPV